MSVAKPHIRWCKTLQCFICSSKSHPTIMGFGDTLKKSYGNFIHEAVRIRGLREL